MHPTPILRTNFDPFANEGWGNGARRLVEQVGLRQYEVKGGDLDVLNVKTFGAKGDGSTDDYAAIQAAIDTVQGSISPNTHGFAAVALYFPPGLYRVTQTIRVERRSLRLTGCHGYGNWPTQGTRPGMGSALLYDGPIDGNLIELRDTRDCYIADIMLLTTERSQADSAINAISVARANSGANRSVRVERSHIGPYAFEPKLGGFRRPIRFSGLNADNDRFSISDTFIATGASTEACLTVEEPQSIFGSCSNVTFDGAFLKTAQAVGVRSTASLSLYNCIFNRCFTDIEASSSANVCVYGYNTERSQRWLEVKPNTRGISEARITVMGGLAQVSEEMLERDGGYFVVYAPGLNGNGAIIWENVKSYDRLSARRDGAVPTWMVTTAAESSGSVVSIRNDSMWRRKNFDVSALRATNASKRTTDRVIPRTTLAFVLDNGVEYIRHGLIPGQSVESAVD